MKKRPIHISGTLIVSLVLIYFIDWKELNSGLYTTLIVIANIWAAADYIKN
jgi:hypothetical protein